MAKKKSSLGQSGIPSFCSNPNSKKIIQLLYHSKPFPEKVATALSDQFTKIQTYFSPMERVFNNIAPGKAPGYILNCAEWVCDLSGFVDPFRCEGIVDNPENIGTSNTESQRNTKLFIKRSHILDPITYMQGDYVLPEDGVLPSYQQPWQFTLAKVNHACNEAYTDALFAVCASRIVEDKISPHWVRCHGTFCARVKEYVYDISDQYETLQSEPWFSENLAAGVFELRILDEYGEASSFHPLGSRQRKPRASLRSDSSADVNSEISCAESLENEHSDSEEYDSATLDVLEEADPEVEGGTPVSVSTPQLRIRHASSEEGVVADDESDYSEESTGPPVVAVFKNFPVMVTALERCEGTMDDLLEDDENIEDDDTKEIRWTAWIFQIIAALSVAQNMFHFVHNDLHTNNIMWDWTPNPTIYYHLKNAPGGDRFYAIPTFGRMFKIIDFNRANYHLGKRGGFFISDAYEEEGDASGQYNCHPFYDQKFPRIDPNPSFDLCRLSYSLIDSLFPEIPEEKEFKTVISEEPAMKKHETVSSLYNLLWSWLIRKNGYNVKENADGIERFPGFELYKIIAAEVTGAVPCEQATRPIFNDRYKISKEDIPEGETIWEVPCSFQK